MPLSFIYSKEGREGGKNKSSIYYLTHCLTMTVMRGFVGENKIFYCMLRVPFVCVHSVQYVHTNRSGTASLSPSNHPLLWLQQRRPRRTTKTTQSPSQQVPHALGTLVLPSTRHPEAHLPVWVRWSVGNRRGGLFTAGKDQAIQRVRRKTQEPLLA